MGKDEEIRLPGGNLGGAVRVGDTVRRHAGPWSPAVHSLLAFLGARLPNVPRVLGYDQLGREVLSYLPGRVIDIDSETLSTRQIVSIVTWTRDFHAAVTGFTHPGPWRFRAAPGAALIGHNDIAPYNVCFDGDDLTGVFDWDLAGPSTPLLELAFIAWNCVPLWRDTGAATAASRLRLIADTYGTHSARQILHAVPRRIQILLETIPAAAAAGDAGMAKIMAAGEPGRSATSLAGLLERIPSIDSEIAAIDLEVHRHA